MKSNLDLINHGIAKFATLPLFSSLSSKNIFIFIKTIRLLNTYKIKKLKTEGVRSIFKEIVKYYNKGIIRFVIFYFRDFRKLKSQTLLEK